MYASVSRILVFKRDPHAVDGEGVLLILIPVVVTGDVTLHGGDVCHILHADRDEGKTLIAFFSKII